MNEPDDYGNTGFCWILPGAFLAIFVIWLLLSGVTHDLPALASGL